MANEAKVLIWGLGKDFEKLRPLYHKAEQKKDIIITGYVNNQKAGEEIEGKPVLCTDQIRQSVYDFVIISSFKYYWDIREEAETLGVDRKKIVHGGIFSSVDFDFNEACNSGKILDNFFDGCLYDSTYSDRKREYIGNGFHVTLGRKSYCAGLKIEGDSSDADSFIQIGNYTSIAWNVKLEMGLNMDHDYSRVFNYGLTHFGFDYTKVFPKQSFGGYRLEIGSDVWIGKDVSIRSGVHIGDGAVIGSHSYVINDVPAYAVVVGSPAKILEFRFPEEIIDALEKIQWWEWDTEKIEKEFSSFSDPMKFIKKGSVK